MKIVKKVLLHKGSFLETEEWKKIDSEITVAIEKVVYPVGSKDFAINPKTKGNGVKPIKNAFVKHLTGKGWKEEWDPFVKRKKNTGVDLAKIKDNFTFLLEWETGNISSSHRAMNKISKALLRGDAVGGVLILPSRELYRYLTDRIGNFKELEPYFEVWQSLPIGDKKTSINKTAILGVYEIEFDRIDSSVPLIMKGSDGFGHGLG